MTPVAPAHAEAAARLSRGRAAAHVAHAQVPARTAPSGYPRCRWDLVCPALGTHHGLCGRHWDRAARHGDMPTVGQQTLPLET